ncbi:hypothetical protein, conserved [Plasmodium gonderi]|uniref:Tyrosine-protein kinase ephrin type A/B receptor-like domain-containing protein n=1 Tax=Plasmodium gonderi TaxID=77519 RepID=A0A1Y1JFI4_PLAGO|nr:hypothetical protein, conserved [Plasmodium gonderi]GAW81256.1 hypothetical protein, conserved [Plasmodium gonderi]
MKRNIIFFFYLACCLLPHLWCTSIFCNYGEYFKNNKCYPCPENTYTSHRNSESCFSCPAGSFNNKRSSKFIYDCSCDNSFYLNYVGNRCDKCSDLGSNFYCKKNLSELHVDNFESFFKHKNDITFNYFDSCVVKEDKTNVYPFMNNIYIYCKNPNVCLDACGRCSENHEGFMCNNCVQNYHKNIYLKYSICRKCYHIIFIVFFIGIYFFLSLFFFLILFKCINVSLYFYHLGIYKKGTIYFLHYFREFVFYLSLILLLSFSNDLTENERENYTFYEREQTEGSQQLHSGNIKNHYFMNIYMHNVFFDIIKIIYLNFLHFIKLDCLYSGKNYSKLHFTQITFFVSIVIMFIFFTFICNLIFLCGRKCRIRIGVDNEDRNAKEKNESMNKGKRVKNKKNMARNFMDTFIYPLLLHNFTFQNYVNMTIFYDNDIIEFLKISIKICYYQYIQITLYIANSMIMFIFLSSYMCIGLFNYSMSYYDTATLCYNNLHLKIVTFMGIPIISCICFIYYIILFISIYLTPADLKQNYTYKYTYGLHTFLCKQEKYYYYMIKILFINILFLFIMRMDDHLNCLTFLSFGFLFLIFFSIFVNPYIETEMYNIKLENFCFMFLFFFNLQLEQIRLVTYHILLRIILSFITMFIYTFILLYYVYFMLKDVYLYFTLYIKYINRKNESIKENTVASIYSSVGQFYFFYYLKEKMNENIIHIDQNQNILSGEEIHSNVLENYHVEKHCKVMSKKDMDYIYNQCVLISPFIPETIVQLLFITKNINHIIRLKRNNSNVKIYNFLFEHGYIEIQKTPVDRFVTVAAHIYQYSFKGNYILFRAEMIRLFTDLVRYLKCFKDVYIRECVANRIRKKYKIGEIQKQKVKYDENYEQKHINTFLYKLRGSDKNVDDRHQAFSKLFPNAGNAVLKKVYRKNKKRDEYQN